MIEAKDFPEFLSNISKAELLAEGNEMELAKVSFLKAKGYFSFSQHKKVIEYIKIPLEYCSGEESLKLKSYYGVSLGYVGEFNQARKTFIEILQKTRENKQLLTETYLNLIWLYLHIGKEHLGEAKLKEVKEYLDSSVQNIKIIPNNFKWKIYNGYCLYYYHLKDYTQALESLKKAVEFCEEKYLSHLYTNFAEIYLMFENEDVFPIIKEYTHKAEVLANKYEDSLGMARAFYIQAMSELKADQFFEALDTLYLAFEHFKDVETYPLAFDSLIKINELMNNYKVDRLKALKEAVKIDFKGTPFWGKL